jgi:hypothetical protein
MKSTHRRESQRVAEGALRVEFRTLRSESAVSVKRITNPSPQDCPKIARMPVLSPGKSILSLGKSILSLGKPTLTLGKPILLLGMETLTVGMKVFTQGMRVLHGGKVIFRVGAKA